MNDNNIFNNVVNNQTISLCSYFNETIVIIIVIVSMSH